MRKAGKALLGAAAYTLGLHRRVLRDRAVIVAFHRVSSSAAGGSLNCAPDMFAGLCQFFKKHFSVKPLSELISRLRENAPVDNMLSITFDDGYRDNFDVAAPILRQYDLPATFFVATNFIDSDTVPPWDAEDGVRSEWMSWNQVRELRRLGFDIGAHTMNHANLGQLDLEEAQREIEGSRDRLERELGTTVPHFAYPFGGPANVTRAVAELVAELGFKCCLSCHGGIVSIDDDVFELRREPINTWVESPYQYGFELLVKAMEARI